MATVLGAIPPFLGPLIYMLFRPPEYLEDVRERELEMLAIEERLAEHDLRCPVCRGPVEASFLVCPVCTTRLKQACTECAAPLEPIWQVCPYCATPVPPGVVTGEDVLQPVRPRRARRSGIDSARDGRRDHPRPRQAGRRPPRAVRRGRRARRAEGLRASRRAPARGSRRRSRGEHYAEHKGKPFFGELVDFITSGPVLALAVRGEDAIGGVRSLMGATHPKDAAPGTIRGDLATLLSENVVHGSDSSASARRELRLFFPDGLL